MIHADFIAGRAIRFGGYPFNLLSQRSCPLESKSNLTFSLQTSPFSSSLPIFPTARFAAERLIPNNFIE